MTVSYVNEKEIVHSALVDLSRQCFQVVRSPKTFVQLGGIRDPVAVVGIAIRGAWALIVL